MPRPPVVVPSVLVALAALAAPAAASPPGLRPITEPSPYHATPPLPAGLPAPQHAPAPSTPNGSEAPSTRTRHHDGGTTIERSGFTARIAADGTMSFDDRTFGVGIASSPVTGPVGVIQFDLTDIVMRWVGEDPYLYEKLSMLESTRPARQRLKARHDARVMREALDALPSYLGAIWSTDAWSIETRRAILFALWDEAAEGGNPLVAEGGAEARRQITHFIAGVLPAGSPEAFTPAELAAYNARRMSAERFAPYGEELAPLDPYADEGPAALAFVPAERCDAATPPDGLVWALRTL